MKQNRLWLWGFLLLFAWGCDSAIYSERMEIEKGVWAYEDVKIFEFESPDTTSLYDIQLTVEHAQSFDYQNFYMQLYTIFPNKDTVHQPFSIDVSNKFGQWIGDCSSDYCTRTSILQPQARFEHVGTYQLVFEQYSRQDSLEGIRALQVDISPSEE